MKSSVIRTFAIFVKPIFHVSHSTFHIFQKSILPITKVPNEASIVTFPMTAMNGSSFGIFVVHVSWEAGGLILMANDMSTFSQLKLG